jgi:DNA replication protein DnaC
MYELPTMPPTLRILTDVERDWLRRQYPSAPDTPAQCVTCGGNREFRWYGYDAVRPPESPTEVVPYRCPCDEQYLMHSRYLFSGIGMSYQRLSWRDFMALTDDLQRVALDYVQHLDGYLSSGVGLILHGPDRGTGKTMFSLLLAKQIVAAGRGLFATTFGALLDQYTGTWRDAEARAWFGAHTRNVDVLVVDDLGREYGGLRNVGESALEDVLRHRAQHDLATILTTNLTPAEILSGYGGHTMSVLSERSILAGFAGADRRVEVRDRMVFEIQHGLRRPVVVA